MISVFSFDIVLVSVSATFLFTVVAALSPFPPNSSCSCSSCSSCSSSCSSFCSSSWQADNDAKGTSGYGKLDFEEFCRFYKLLMTRPEIGDVVVKYGSCTLPPPQSLCPPNTHTRTHTHTQTHSHTDTQPHSQNSHTTNQQRNATRPNTTISHLTFVALPTPYFTLHPPQKKTPRTRTHSQD